VLTLLVLILSEIIPKTLGAKFWRSFAAPTTNILRGMVLILTYFPPILPALRLLTRLIGGKGHGGAISRAELSAMAEVSSQSGELEDEESRILQNLFLFKSSKVRDIMTPRTVVYAMKQSTKIDEFLAEAMSKPFSRVPIYEPTRDHITGFVLKSDIMSARLNQEDEGKTLVDFIRPIKAVSEKSSIFHTFKIMTQEKQHLMLVVDEFGGMDGIVSMEDVVETLLGMEIVDEADRNEDMQVLARNLWAKRAKAMGISEEKVAEAP
jgi:CBS domain containing-hemolysin-like protein